MPVCSCRPPPLAPEAPEARSAAPSLKPPPRATSGRPPAQLSSHPTPLSPQSPQGAAPAPSAPARLGCGRGCLNRTTQIFCDSRLCPCGKACSNRPFHLLPAPKLKSVLTEGRGYGVVAGEDIPARSFVVEYVGEILDDKTCEQRLWKDKSQGQENFYMMEISHNQARERRGERDDCDP